VEKRKRLSVKCRTTMQPYNYFEVGKNVIILLHLKRMISYPHKYQYLVYDDDIIDRELGFVK